MGIGLLCQSAGGLSVPGPCFGTNVAGTCSRPFFPVTMKLTPDFSKGMTTSGCYIFFFLVGSVLLKVVAILCRTSSAPYVAQIHE